MLQIGIKHTEPITLAGDLVVTASPSLCNSQTDGCGFLFMLGGLGCVVVLAQSEPWFAASGRTHSRRDVCQGLAPIYGRKLSIVGRI